MSLRSWILYILVLCLVIFACGGKGPGLAEKKAVRPLEELKGAHPRLLLTAGKQQALKGVLETTHKWLWDRYLQDLPSLVAAVQEPLPEEVNRGHAGRAPDICFAWLMTGDSGLLEAAKNYLLALARGPEWDPSNDLVHGHLLQGMALAYDWLYPSLTPEQRSLVFERLGREAEAEYQRMTSGRVWYRTQFLQNHSLSNYCGLTYAAAALYGEAPRAGQWLDLCQTFFDSVFVLLPSDGTSVEGLSYGSYGLEFVTRYTELADKLLGRDYYGSPWLKNSPLYLIHSLLPSRTESEWAMTFGDAPRNSNWHGPEPQLFLLASRYRDTAAQWLGRHLISLPPRGLGSAGWWAILFYDPTVGEADPSEFPTLHHFTDLDQVMMRSSWTDTSAMLVGTLCGPFMGRNLSRNPVIDFGSAHGHPDKGSFQIFAHGQWFAVDPLYTGFKRTANHNCMLVKGNGQLGEDIAWFAAAEAVRFNHYPRILQVNSAPSYDYVVADLARAYHPALGLKKYLRHFLFVKPDILIVADQLALDDHGALFSYPSEVLTTGEGLDHNSSGYVVGSQGEASVVFQGQAGTYHLTANYLDNYPGTGKYSFLVDGVAVHSFQNDNQDTDNNFEVSPAVELKPGSRIAFRGAPMSRDFRLIKMTAYSDGVPAPRSAQWLVHFDPGARLERKSSRIEVSMDGARLDFYCLAPAGAPLEWETFKIKRAEIEAFTLRETKRLTITPAFQDSSALVLTLMHVRPQSALSLENLKAELADGKALISWSLPGRKVAVDWDLEQRKLSLE